MKFKVKRFDPSTMKMHRIIIVVGKRGTGKSTLQVDLMEHLSRKVDFGLAMTPTEESVREFRKHMPDPWIYNNFSSTKMETMLAMQRDLVKKNKAKNLFIILDDVMYDKKVLKGTPMRDLFMNGRHLKITLCNAMQYVMDMGPDLRTNVDYIFALRENIASNRQKLWKYFYGVFDKYDDFCKVMDRCTENYSALVMDNTTGSNKLEDCIFWYKARTDVPEFTMGKEVYAKITRSFEVDEEEDDDEMNMIAQSERKKISFVQCEQQQPLVRL